MRNLKRCFNFTAYHDTCMTLPRHWCHGQNFKENGRLYIKHDTMILFPVKLYICKNFLTRAHIYCHSIMFFKKIESNYRKTMEKVAMTLSEKSIMQVSWQYHGVMAESLLTTLVHLFLVGLIAWRVLGGATC